MKQGIRARAGQLMAGLHFKFLSLVVSVAAVMLAAQLTLDTIGELKSQREQRLNDALGVTNVIARSLEKQFEYIELDDIEQILASVRKRSDIKQLTVVDRHKTFFLDGDLMTSPVIAVNNSEVQEKALTTAKTSYEITDGLIRVAEPLLAGGKVSTGIGAGLEPKSIGSVTIAFENPGLFEILIPIVKSKLYAVIPILVIGLIFAARMISQITAPLKSLARTAEEISGGDFDSEAEIIGALEVRQLAKVFNQMVATIRENIAQIYDLAYVDKITRLPNREFFRRELSQAIAKVQRNGANGALLFVDLDGFKRVNDTFGHDFGDKLLAGFAERIGDVVRHGDHISLDAANDLKSEAPVELDENGKPKRGNTFARLGGDEFTILLPETRSETDAASVAMRIIKSVEEPFVIDGKEITVGTSIGISTFPRDGQDYQTIMKHADMAMYQAKDEGKNTFRFFSSELNTQAVHRMEIETDLRQAISNGELELYYQPKINAVDGSPYGLEGLIRWHHPERGMVNPGEFISIAEECGLILPLGEYVIETACRQLVEFAGQNINLPIAINISMQQFEKPDFAQTVKRILDETGADPSRLELEITESMAMNDPDIALRHIETLKAIGVRFAIDDFGTGYSNLAQLSRLPFDVFKIDRSFIMTLGEEGNGETIVRTIIAMAHSLNYETVAEGVETEIQAATLRAAGCSIMQGFLYAKPMAIGDLQSWLNDKKPARKIRRKAA